MNTAEVLRLAVDAANIVAPLAAVVSILIAVRVYRRQMNAQLFVAYTQRYEEIMQSFPPEARALRRRRSQELPVRSEALTLAVLRYLNLCAEEFYLHRTGHLTTALWGIWEDELKRTVASDLVRREWPDLRSEFASYPEFLDYIENVQVASIGAEAREMVAATGSVGSSSEMASDQGSGDTVA